MNHQKVLLELTRCEAIVLMQLLMRFRDKELLMIEHESEEQLLWDMCCMIEDKLPELLDPGWSDLLDRARATVLDDSGF